MAALLTLTAAPAAAQVSAAGGTTQLLGSTTRGVDAAYDPVNDVYLAIGAYGAVTGVFVNASGQPVSSPFTISGGAGHANFARARYSAALGGFMIVWSSEDTPTSLTVRSRGARYPGVLLGSEQVVSDAGSPPWLESAPALDYSSSSQQFLVAWQGYPPSVTIKTRLVGLDGAGVGSVVALSNGYGRDPGVAWNPNRNEFGVSFSGETPTGSYSALAIVPASNPAGFRRTTFNVLGGGILTYITDLAFSTSVGHYVMTWYEAVKSRVAEFDQDGNQLRGDIASLRVGMYDSLGVAYNPVSHTFLLGGLDPQTDNFTSVELNKNGVRIGSEVLLGSGSAYYGRVAASQDSARWLGTYSRTFLLTGVPAQTGSTDGGAAGGTTTSPPPTTTTSTCPGGEIPGMTCVNGEYVPTESTGGGGTSTGGDGSCPGGVIPGMTCVNGEYIPTDSTGGTTTTTGGDGSCPGGVIPGMTCVNGDYIPTGSTSTTTTGGDGSCGGGVIPGMTCINGEYVYTGGTTTTTTTGGDGSCGGGVIPGMTCINGEYVYTGATTTTTTGGDGTCAGGVIAGMTCVNGEYIYTGTTGSLSGDGTCAGGAIAGMTCINGEYIYTGSSGGGGGSLLPVCTGGNEVPPVSGWLRIGLYDWIPPDHPSAPLATCRSL